MNYNIAGNFKKKKKGSKISFAQQTAEKNEPNQGCTVLYGPHLGRNGEISYISIKYSKRRNFDL